MACEARAQALLEAVSVLRPDILIHLGNIYYAGSVHECDAFFRNVCRVPRPARVQLVRQP